ncbi:nickel ABC transporter permease [Paenibacillus humicola]|uniref:nickel ABC transporter permease n=1 Tax=Paenibacillus humicola TaxID=3110540 RepID=UPI00237AB358|nr:nickel ABC transporter permease [Paenibacillus humicola]
MMKFLVRRLVHTLIVLFGISLIVFFCIRLTGDPAAAMFQGTGQPTKEALDQIRHALGLDKPLWEQYATFIGNMLSGNMGHSFRNNEPVFSLIAERMGATVSLAAGGVAVALLIAFPVGILSAVKRGGLMDMFGRIFSLAGISFPNFWLAIMFILVFAVHLHWLPASGYNGPKYLILPSLSLGLILAGVLARLIRSSMLDVLHQHYIRTAKAKGVAEWAIIIRHALRNALIPTITFLGLQLGALLGGVVILEQVFSWPGVGRLVLDAINDRDYPVVQGSVMFLSFLLMLVNLLVDISYGFIDPRIKLGRGRT